MRITKLLVPALLALLSTGCSSDDSPTAAPLDMSEGGTVLLRVAHLSPDAPAVDVWLDGSVVLSSVPFQTISNYLEIGDGVHRIQVTPTGVSDPVVIDAEVTLDTDRVYTVAATGLLATGTLDALVLVDDLATSASGARVRFVHTSPDAPAVDVAVANGGPVVFGNVSFRNASGYGDLAAGTYDLEVRLAGSHTVVLPLNGFNLAGGTTYTVFAIGLAGDGSLGALPVVDAN